MEILSSKIAATLEREPYCLVPISELARVWPNPFNRLLELQRFADQHGWTVFSYSAGLGAMFVPKSSSPKSGASN